MSSNVKYTITLNDEQARIVNEALDLFSRVHMAQFDAVVDEFLGSPWLSGKDAELRIKILDVLRSLARIMTTTVTGNINSHFGITGENTADVARDAWDIKQVLRHARAYHSHPDGVYTVDFNTPHRCGTQQLPKVEVTTCED